MKWDINDKAYPTIINLLQKKNQDNYVIFSILKYS